MLIALTPCKSSKSNQSCKSSKSSRSRNFKFYHFYIDYLLCKSYKPLSVKHFGGSFTTFTTFTAIARKPPLTDRRPREVNTCNSLPGLFLGALTLLYEYSILYSKHLCGFYVTQMKRKPLKSAILWS